MSDGTESSRRWIPLALDFILSKYTLANRRTLLVLTLWIGVIALSIISTVWIAPSEFMLIERGSDATSLFFLFYPPLILGTLMLFWLGFEWGFIPLFLSAFIITFNMGMTYYWGLLFGVAFILGLGIYGITYYCVSFDPALRDLKSFVFYAMISFFAAMASSLGSFVWSDFFNLETYQTTLLWKGWWTGMFLQSMLITAPILYLFTPFIYKMRDKYFTEVPYPKVSLNWIYSAIASVAVVLLLFIGGAKMLGTEALNTQLATLQPSLGNGLVQTSESLQIISWISIGLVVSLGIGGIYLVGSWNHQLQSQVDEKTKQLRRNEELLRDALSERDLFLDTIHHRIRDNLTKILALLELQLKNDVDKSISDILKDSYSRISCLALIHETLDQSESFRNLDVRKYAVKLSNRLQKRFQDESKQIDVILNIDNVIVDIDKAVPLAMIMNELMVNAYIHGFNDRKAGVIIVDFDKKEEGVLLKVRDNGAALPNNFDSLTQKALGFKLVKTLVKQLHGEIDIEDREKPSFRIMIPNNVLVEA